MHGPVTLSAQHTDFKKVQKFFKNSRYFQDLTEQEIESFVPYTEIHIFSKGAPIITQGEEKSVCLLHYEGCGEYSG